MGTEDVAQSSQRLEGLWTRSEELAGTESDERDRAGPNWLIKVRRGRQRKLSSGQGKSLVIEKVRVLINIILIAKSAGDGTDADKTKAFV